MIQKFMEDLLPSHYLIVYIKCIYVSSGHDAIYNDTIFMISRRHIYNFKIHY